MTAYLIYKAGSDVRVLEGDEVERARRAKVGLIVHATDPEIAETVGREMLGLGIARARAEEREWMEAARERRR